MRGLFPPLKGRLWLLGLLLFLLVRCAVGPQITTPSPTPMVSAPLLYRATPQGVFRGDEPVSLYGINWFGLETADRAPHGLWAGRTVADFLAQMRELGLTALRLPLSPQVLVPGHPTASWARRAGYPADAHEGLRYFLDEAQRAGLYVLLDFHTYDPHLIGAKLPGRPFGDGYTRADWLGGPPRVGELSPGVSHAFRVYLSETPHPRPSPAGGRTPGQALGGRVHPGGLAGGPASDGRTLAGVLQRLRDRPL